jgi:glycosyltransferase involved in cell wall biosynthesis/peptidoglycan biosynthesis protein MviN/MurJ (putative lipid II flippase)
LREFLQGQLSRPSRGGALLAVLTLGLAGLFKIAAFAREAFIASRFGLSSFTDAYFASQQFPLILVTFMFGAFSLAFTPAYAAEKRETGRVAWLPGLLVYGGLLGGLLTLLMLGLAPWLLRALSNAPAPQALATLAILSVSFAPVIWLGIWASVMIAAGRNLLAMFVTGLPYLSMTVLLIGLYALGKLDVFSLPVSFLAGFGIVGCSVLIWMSARECQGAKLAAVLETWKMPGFRRFLSQLSASSIENVGYAANQLLLVYFVARAGTGAVSANTCAMRVGMLGFTLLGQPLAQLVQAKLCAAPEEAQSAVFKRWLLAILSTVLTFAALLYAWREPVTRLVYLHGKFSSVELSRVVEIVPAWSAYFVVASLNAMAARFLFIRARGSAYVRLQLCAYAAANLIRIAFWGRLTAPEVIWCSVLTEGCALLVNLRSCLPRKTAKVDEAPRIVLHTPEPASSASLYVEALAGALAAAQTPVRVVCPGNHQARETMQCHPLIEVRVCRHRATQVSVSVFTKIVENLSFVMSSAKTLWRATQPGDIVHLQYILHLPFGLLFFLCARARGAHIVFTVHDPLPHKFLFPRILRSLERASLGWAYRWSDVLIVHSNAGKRLLLEQFQVSPDRVRVIPHGPYELKKKVRPCNEEDRLEVLFFGSLRENKGLHLAIESVQTLAREGLPVRLTIAGQVVNRNEEAYWARCRALIDGESAAVRLIETFVPDDGLAELFSHCHCFVLPYTTFSSDSGVAYMALANAKPIVATDAGGLGWLLENSRGGVRIAEASVAGVSVALRQALEMGAANLERQGRMGKEWVLAECGWPRVAHETQAVYAELIPQLKANPAPLEDVSEILAFEAQRARSWRETVSGIRASTFEEVPSGPRPTTYNENPAVTTHTANRAATVKERYTTSPISKRFFGAGHE